MPYLNDDGDQIKENSRKAQDAMNRLNQMVEYVKMTFKIPDGKVEIFGSFNNGFKTGTSDLDVVYTSKDI
jgi:predicted nucleotidyltransferase